MNAADIEAVAAALPPISEAEWARILDGRRVRWLIKQEQVDWAGKRARSCGSCKHTHMSGDPRRGWCTEHQFLVSMAFPVLCRQFESA